jgi:pimeloyl-ACP methyl ester carboxylesterase
MRVAMVVSIACACTSASVGGPACNRSPAKPEPIVTPLPIVTPIDEPFVPTSFAATVHGHGRPIILIPGIGCPGSVWDGVVEHLSDAETHVIELAGFAGRPPIAGPLEATARVELAAYIKANHLDHPVVIGHSLGGFLAMWLAASEPDLVGPTIIVDAAPAIGGTVDPQVARAYSDQWRTASAGDFADSVRDFFAPMANDARALAPIIAQVARSDHRAFADAFDELFSTDLRGDVGKIRVPVLVVLSELSPLDELRTQTADIADREIVVVPNTRHFVFIDNPPGFFTAVDQFLVAHPPGDSLAGQPKR